MPEVRLTEGIRFHVEGRVQGVGFRAWVRATANRLGLVGYVRNLPDGSVEVEAAGPAEALDALRSALQVGPPAARVTSVSESPTQLDDVSGFSIRY